MVKNENIKVKFNKLSGIFDIIKKRPTNEITPFLDELARKLIEIIHHEIKNSVPEIKIEDRNTYLPEYIRQKIKMERSLKRLYIQTKDISIKPSFNLIKKEIKKGINDYRDKQWENKFKKTRIS